jgi:HlyD family secretion protein
MNSIVKWFSILIALAGTSLAIYAAATQDADKPPVPAPAAAPSINPFAKGIAASGVVEPASRTIPLGVPEAGLVTQVLVTVGQQVTAGQPLLKLDDRVLQAERTRLVAARAVMQARYDRLKAAPRAETLPPQAALVDLAQVRVRDAEDRLSDLTKAGAGAVSSNDISRARFAVEAAKAELARAQADLALTTAGTWSEELGVARAELAATEADILAVEQRIDRLTVKAPIAGTILKRNMEPGQYATVGAGSPALVIGDLSKLRVRARVDEEDAPLLRDKAPAALRVRGIATETVPLTWLWVEPLAEPKNALTGASTERVDTRVVEVLFDLAATPGSRLFPGQIVDVFISTETVAGK